MTVHSGIFQNSTYRTTFTTLVTAFDSSHFLPGLELLISVEDRAPHWKVRLWDLGLSESERNYIRFRHPKVDVEVFPFNSYPEHFKMEKNAGSFAWKPEIVWRASQDARDLLIWMDAGNRLVGRPFTIERLARKYAFYSPYSAGTIQDWTHAATLMGMNVPKATYGKKNLNGALIAFDLSNERARRLLNSWHHLASDRELLCPDGSDLTNHRQDQSILSCVAQMAGYDVPRCLCYVNRALGVAIHTDNELSDGVLGDVMNWRHRTEQSAYGE